MIVKMDMPSDFVDNAEPKHILSLDTTQRVCTDDNKSLVETFRFEMIIITTLLIFSSAINKHFVFVDMPIVIVFLYIVGLFAAFMPLHYQNVTIPITITFYDTFIVIAYDTYKTSEKLTTVSFYKFLYKDIDCIKYNCSSNKLLIRGQVKQLICKTRYGTVFNTKIRISPKSLVISECTMDVCNNIEKYTDIHVQFRS